MFKPIHHHACVFLLFILVLLSACNGVGLKSEKSTDIQRKDTIDIKALAKSDINAVLDVHVRQSRRYCRELMVKLYRRNPRELTRSGHTLEENIQRLFDKPHDWELQKNEGVIGIDAIRISFRETYAGDRVFSFVTGLYSMILSSYGYKKDFYMLDEVDPQKLYNSARNIEIAAWMLNQQKDSHGDPVIYSNSLADEDSNMSYERLLGKLIAVQDTMALTMEGKTRRLINKVVQKMATAVFLPI